MKEEVKVGLKREINFIVSEELTAEKVGSGSLPVFSTPSMLAAMEKASLELLEDFLDDEETTVGISANITHVAASKIGASVNVVSEITKVEGKKISYYVKAFSNDKLIGEGFHERFVVNKIKFMNKL